MALLFFNVQAAHSASGDAERLVKNFYHWYIVESSNRREFLPGDDTIYEYVDKAVVDHLRELYEKSAFFDADYFTKSQDIWVEWLDVLTIHQAVKMDDALSIVPVSFKLTEDRQHHIVIFVGNKNGLLRITKVSGVYPFEDTPLHMDK